MLGKNKKEKKGKSEYQPSEDELMLVNDVYDKFRTAKQAKDPYVETWKKCIDAYNSDYFKDINKPEYKSDEISNFIFSTLETIKPIMFDNDPQIVSMPKTIEGFANNSKIQSMFDYEWHRDNMSKKVLQAVTLALQTGTAIFSVLWNSKDGKGVGNVNNVLVNPFNFFPDPMATSIEDAEYIIYATYKHANVLKNQYPDKANLLDGGAINEQELAPSGSDIASVRNQILVLECWQRDYTTVEYEEVVDGSPVKKRKKRYPKGRVVTVAPEHNVVLSDKENPYEDGDFPFVMMKCYDVPFQFWGKGEVEQLLSPQQYINDLTNQIIDTVKLTANMPWVLDKNCGVPKGALTNRPGLIIRKNPGTNIDRLPPPNMPNYPRETIEVLKRDIETISGIHDVTQGRKPGSISAASAIMALQDAGQARIRLKVRLLELALGEIGSLWFSRIKQFWVTDREIRNSKFNAKSSMRNSLEDFFYVISQEDLTEDYDFVIVGESTMPSNKPAMLDMLIRLAQTTAEDGLPMVDRDTLLTYTNIPNISQIGEKFQNIIQGQQEAQQGAMMEEEAMLMEQQGLEQQIAEEEAIAQEQEMAQQGGMSDDDIAQILALIQENPQEFQMLLEQLGMGAQQQEPTPRPMM